MSSSTRKKASKSPKTVAQTLPDSSHWDALDRPLVRILIASCIVLLIASFYLSQNLFNANNLNDFSEYYLRAQDWSNGTLSVGGGSDVLLSAVEYVGISLHPNDFLASYFATSKFLIFLVMSASLLFVLRENKALPSYWVKLSSVILTLSIPHFLFATVTIDQTLLFAACLLFFLSTYNIPWAGWVSVLVFFSRPEAIIIIPMYALLWYLDNENRKRILYNAGTFAILLICAKLGLSALTPATGGKLTSYQEYGFLNNLGWEYIKGLSSHLLNIPIILFTYAFECLQSSVLFALFTIGFVFSIRQRTTWPVYGILVFFLTAYAVLYATSEASSYSHFTTQIKRMSLEREYFIVNAFNKFDGALGHGRYRLVLYPAIALFVVQGISLSIGFVVGFFSKRNADRYKYIIPLSGAFLCAFYFLGSRYQPIAKAYAADAKLEAMHPVYKLGLSMRKQGNIGTVLLDNFCDPSQGSFLIELAAYGGIDNILTRFCDNSRIWTFDANNQSQVLDAEAYKTQMPLNDGLHGLFYRSTAKQSELYDTTTIRKWQAAASTYNDSLLRSMNITHIIAARHIQSSSLKLIDSISGAYLHSVSQ